MRNDWGLQLGGGREERILLPGWKGRMMEAVGRERFGNWMGKEEQGVDVIRWMRG